MIPTAAIPNRGISVRVAARATAETVDVAVNAAGVLVAGKVAERQCIGQAPTPSPASCRLACRAHLGPDAETNWCSSNDPRHLGVGAGMVAAVMVAVGEGAVLTTNAQAAGAADPGQILLLAPQNHRLLNRNPS